MTTITIATPFYNEEIAIDHYIDTIYKVLKKIPNNIKVSLLWIDDGSKDKTLSILKNKKKIISELVEVKIISHQENYGYGRTILNSIKNCTTEFMITYDADCCYDYNLIFELINKIMKDKYDVISVSYKLVDKKMNVSFFRNLLSHCSTTIYKIFFKKIKLYKLTYINCSFRIYKIKAIENLDILSDNFNGCAELLIKCMKKNLKISEIPGSNTGRLYGNSKMHVFKNIFHTLFMILKIKLNIEYNKKIINNFLIF